MIRQIRGTVLSLEREGVVVEVGGGFGIFVRVPGPESFSLDTEATLFTHLAVKQDGLELYGFPDPADLAFFELLLQVSGVGPKTALSILKRAPREALESAIAKRDISYLTRVVGLGKKAAEKLAIELSEKLNSKETSETGSDAEVFDTLVALGYTDREARRALASIAENISGKEARLRAALSGAK
jgi:Holliday junction DNA helicase RuvA